MVSFWYLFTSFLLGVILFFPTRKFILAMNVNRFQNKHKREITEEERAALTRKVSIFAAVIAVTFAFLYNKIVMLKFFGKVG